MCKFSFVHTGNLIKLDFFLAAKR